MASRRLGNPAGHREVQEARMKRFQYSRVALSAAAVIALAVELGAGHKF